MDQSTLSLAAETKALREAYAAFNRNDLTAFAQLFDVQIEWIEPAGFPGCGTRRGMDLVLAHLTQARATWAEGSCDPKRIIVAGDRIIQLVHVRVRLKHEAEWREGQVAEVYTFHGGKVTQVRLFADGLEALEWAGVKTPGSN